MLVSIDYTGNKKKRMNLGSESISGMGLALLAAQILITEVALRRGVGGEMSEAW